MHAFITDLRQYVGQPDSIAYDGYLGLELGQHYELAHLERPDGTCIVRLTHAPYDTGTTWLYLQRTQFERWFRPVPPPGPPRDARSNPALWVTK